MKKTITAITTGFLLLFPPLCTAAWVIHLKDGRSFTTPEYREEGDQIKFKRYGGLIGIPKDQVKKIEEVKGLPEEKEEAVARKKLPAEPQKANGVKQTTERGKTGAGSAKGGEKAKQEETDKIDVLLEEKRYLEREIKRIYSKFKEAKSKTDKKTQQAYFQELKSLRGELTELEERVKAISGGKLPDWWREA